MPSQQPSRTILDAIKPWSTPAAIILAGIIISILMTVLNPGPAQKERTSRPMLVEAQVIKKQHMTIAISSQGRVAPHIRTTLISEVSGSVIEVSEHFVSGGFIRKGQLLLQLDDRNYRSAVKQAEANVARRRKELIQEKGKAQVAYRQWKKNKNTKRSKEALSLLLREPQIIETKANLAFAKAELERVKGDLKKTKIHAPYDGLIKKKFIDYGQYATPGSSFAEVIAIDYAEVRLAIPQDKMAYLKLPMITLMQSEQLASTADTAQQLAAETVATETAVGAEAPDTPPAPYVPVTLKSVHGDVEHEWQAKLVRTEGMLDEKSHTLYAVARIDDPYMLESSALQSTNKHVPLLMGTYVEASIQGPSMPNMVKIPRHVLRAGNHVWIIDDNDQLRSRQLEILKTGGEQVYVSGGLEDGERLCLTNIGEVVPGTTVRVVGENKIATHHE